MQIDRSRRNGGTPPLLPEGFMNGVAVRERETDSFASSSLSAWPPSPPATSSSSSRTSSPGVNYIEHRVSKMDTLAGVAIMYGVEVADIKRINGLVTDLQMFAHKSLQIPLPGRHPPSPILLNGSSSNGDHTPPHQPHRDVLESLQSLKLKPPLRRVTPAMSSLQGYYGLTPPKGVPLAEGTEMAVYKTSRALYLEDEPLPRVSPVSDPPPRHHRKSRSLVNGFHEENGDSAEDVAITETGENGEADRSNSEKSVRRRQKTDVDPLCRTPELLMKEESGGAFSGRKGKGLALRPKSGSRTDLDSGRLSAFPMGDSFTADGFLSVRKSSSTSNLQESENSSSIWPTSKWTLKPDNIARPIFDGLPKPMTMRRNKAALD